MASYNIFVLFLTCLLASESLLFLADGATTADVYWTAAITAAPGRTACPHQQACGPCPPNYQVVREHQYGCTYRCLCEFVPYAATTGATTSPKPSLSKSILLSILRNIQGDATALEQMAQGLSDEANLAENLANDSI